MVKRKSTSGVIAVEYFGATEDDCDDLLDYLSVSDAIEDIQLPASRKASGAVQLRVKFYVLMKPILITYASTKLLNIIYDDVAAWYKKRRRKGQFIKITFGKKAKQVGKGKPKRYRR